MSDEVLDVLIVGAGFAGLAAAREFEELGLKYRVVDSFADHVGGRAYSYEVSPTLGFDRGAEYVGDLQNEIMSLARALLPAEGIVNGANLHYAAPMEVMILGGTRFVFDKRKAALGIQGIPPDLGLPSILGVVAMLAEMTLQEVLIDVLEPWNSPSFVCDLDKLSVEQWLGQKAWLTERARDLLRISVEALLSVEATELSPFYLLWYTACNDGLLNEVNDDAGGPQQYWLAKGTSDLAERYAAPVNSKIDRGVRVLKIEHGGAEVTVRCVGGKEYRAKKVLLAMSPHSMGRIHFDPPPPPDRAAFFSLPMGRTIKCQVFYSSRWWYQSNGNMFDGYVGGARYPVLWVMDNSPANADPTGPYVLMTFTVGAHADALQNADDATVRATVLDALQYLFQDPRAKLIDRIVIHRWQQSDPNVGGGPNSIFRPGELTGSVGRLLDQPWGDKLYFACAENARSMNPHTPTRTWNLFNPEHKPTYDAFGVLESTSVGPYFTKYSDLRPRLGYMDGALNAGRFYAHQVASALGNAKAKPAPTPKVAPVAPVPSASGVAVEDAAKLLGFVKDELETVASGGWAGDGAALLEAFGRAVVRDGRVASVGSLEALEQVRATCISLLEHLGADKSAKPASAHPHLDALASDARSLEERLLGLFRKG